MAFQANQTVTKIDLVPSGCAIQIVDTSNYAVDNDPPDPAHLRANFNKKHIIVTSPDSIQWTMDSILAPPSVDQSIDPPSSGAPADTVQFDFNSNDANGTYQVEMFTVPTYESGGVQYDLSANHIVYYAGAFYRTTIENNSSAPNLLVGWEVVDYDYLRTTSKYYVTTNIAITCLPVGNTYQTQLFDTDANSYSVTSQNSCGGIVIDDTSLYEDNTESGHNVDDFSEYRTITIFKPGTSSSVNSYVMSSIATLNPNESISAPSSGNNIINYNFLDSDKDGLYIVAICSYPTWRDTANYTANPITVVYYNGVLYKLLQANTNQVPDAPDSVYWEVYTLDGETEYTTRYCYIARILIWCRNINRCREIKIHEAACVIRENRCNPDILCKNRIYQDATNLLLLKIASEIAMNRRAWDEIEANVDLMNTICNC